MGDSRFTTLYGNCSTVPIRNVVINTPIPTLTPTQTSTPVPTRTPTPTYTPTPLGRADLIVPTIILSDNNSTADDEVVIPKDADNLTFTINVTVTNVGFQESGSFSATVRFDGATYDLGRSNLNRGESVLLTREVTVENPGEYDIRVQIDTSDEVEEQSEVNNTGILPITVEKDIPPPDDPGDSIPNF